MTNHSAVTPKPFYILDCQQLLSQDSHKIQGYRYMVSGLVSKLVYLELKLRTNCVIFLRPDSMRGRAYSLDGATLVCITGGRKVGQTLQNVVGACILLLQPAFSTQSKYPVSFLICTFRCDLSLIHI